MAAPKTLETGRVLSNEQAADGVFEMRVTAPKIAPRVEPGQFVHVRAAGNPVQFLRMPLAVYDVHDEEGEEGSIELCYQVVGEGTRQLSSLVAGDRLDLLGPVGNGWRPPEGTKRALLVGGGVGAPALNLLARRLTARGARTDVALGAQTYAKLSCSGKLRESVAPEKGLVHVATDDGSFGVTGFVTAVSSRLIGSGIYDYVAVCGPVPMMRNAVQPALRRGVACQVSMETLMACGVGACLSCVVDTVDGRKRCCVDGPVFDAGEVVW